MGRSSNASGAMAGRGPCADECLSGVRMVRRAFPSRGRALLSRRGSDRSPLLGTISFAALLSFVTVLGLSRWVDVHSLDLGITEAPVPAKRDVAIALAGRSEGLLDPAPLSGPEAAKFAPAAPAASSFRSASSQPPASAEAPVLAD